MLVTNLSGVSNTNQLIKAVVAVSALHGNVRNADSQASSRFTSGCGPQESVFYFLTNPPDNFDVLWSLQTTVSSLRRKRGKVLTLNFIIPRLRIALDTSELKCSIHMPGGTELTAVLAEAQDWVYGQPVMWDSNLLDRSHLPTLELRSEVSPIQTRRI